VTPHCSSVDSGSFINCMVGHFLGCSFRHSGPCHHNLQFFRVSRYVPPDTRSAGLLEDAMCFHSHPLAISSTWETLLATDVFHLLADVANHERTIVESIHNRILAIFKFKISIVFCTSHAKSKVPHNSRLGSVIFLTVQLSTWSKAN
jgi:hypothetical protein